jgi:D-alanyl-D-alanine carboxypeptidase
LRYREWCSQKNSKIPYQGNGSLKIVIIIFEPWHFRYIGFPHSEILYKEGIVFDTYIKILREDKVKYFKDEKNEDYIIWLLSGFLKPEKFEFNTSNGIGVSSDNGDDIILTMKVK